MTAADFIIAGVQKGGTTALHHFLSMNPQVFLPASKEVHFFDDESVDWDHPPYPTYEDNFAAAQPGLRCGEATPIYSYWPPSMERIARYRPAIKIVLAVRDPVARAHSDWRMEARRHWEPLPFADAIRDGRRRVTEDAASMYGCHRIFSYVERGFYAGQVRRMLDLFPREQAFFLTTESLKEDFQGVMDRLADFLEVGRHRYQDSYEVRPLLQPALCHKLLPARDAAYLRALYAADMAETECLTGLDLSSWR